MILNISSQLCSPLAVSLSNLPLHSPRYMLDYIYTKLCIRSTNLGASHARVNFACPACIYMAPGCLVADMPDTQGTSALRTTYKPLLFIFFSIRKRCFFSIHRIKFFFFYFILGKYRKKCWGNKNEDGSTS